MGLVRLLGFSKLPCGCVTGTYLEMATRRDVTYVEEKGPACLSPHHRRNQLASIGTTPARLPRPARLARVS